LADLVRINPKKAKKTAAKRAIRTTKQQAAEAAVQRLLDLAQGELDLPSTLQVNIKTISTPVKNPLAMQLSLFRVRLYVELPPKAIMTVMGMPSRQPTPYQEKFLQHVVQKYSCWGEGVPLWSVTVVVGKIDTHYMTDTRSYNAKSRNFSEL